MKLLYIKILLLVLFLGYSNAPGSPHVAGSLIPILLVTLLLL